MKFKFYIAILCLVSSFSTLPTFADGVSACQPLPSTINSIAARCEEKLRSLFNKPRLRTSADYLTQTSPPLRAVITNPDGSKYCATHDQVDSTPDILRFMPIEDLYKLVSSDEFAKSVAEKYHASLQSPSPDYTIERATQYLRNDAAILLSRIEMPNPRSGEIVSSDLFSRQASFIRAKVEQIPEMFRFDLRSPEEIKRQNGFRPNPAKRPFTIVESISGHIRGGGNTVSATLEPGNSNVLKLALSALVYDGRKIKDLEFSPQTIDIFEYEIKNAFGFVTPDSFGIPTEKEVVTRYLPLANIARYRVHKVHAKSKNQTELLSTSEWRDF